ncbi:MAG: hypothetical protein ABIF82_11675 [Planctomycetota bacterium]
MSDKRLERRSLWFGAPGLIMLLVCGAIVSNTEEPSGAVILLALVGFVLLCIGLGLAAKSKGYPGYYGLLGFFTLFGIIILAVLPDKLAEQAKDDEIRKLRRRLAQRDNEESGEA